MYQNKKLFGNFMYEHSDVSDLFKLVELGIIKLNKAGGVEIVGKYDLEDWKEAWDVAAANATFGRQVVITP